MLKHLTILLTAIVLLGATPSAFAGPYIVTDVDGGEIGTEKRTR